MSDWLIDVWQDIFLPTHIKRGAPLKPGRCTKCALLLDDHSFKDGIVICPRKAWW